MPEHSEAPWHFVGDQAVHRPKGGALGGWIFPAGAGEDDPCVAYVEEVGSVDLALIMAAPDLLAALNQAATGLAMLKSVIQSGESWTPTLDESFGILKVRAHAAIAKATGA